ncbi:hypothetical protein CNMCM5793_000218 [Aspergillus hiratsukae]|uniref:Uncharacterized protein n=1 Tax=Aspergillus hiratsukae TaxID=1194566 RepID=A0A8H6P9E7_9EURO|nr:hypothetical protein CNMCM5793_000218 [Aspergillus hiratsukae]KAF7172124.1 hypothetical protein CNMCM6106_006391 [Aspergillus hiratsukae]
MEQGPVSTRGPMRLSLVVGRWELSSTNNDLELDLSKIEFPSSVIPKITLPTMPMLAGIITKMSHNWDASGYWVPFNHTTAFLKFRTSAPWIQVCDSSGEPLTKGQWEFTESLHLPSPKAAHIRTSVHGIAPRS